MDGERILIVGMSGGGKSTLIKQFLIEKADDYDYIFIADTQGDFLPYVHLNKKIHVMQVNRHNFDDLHKRMQTILTKAENYYTEHLESEKRVLIIVDEVDKYKKIPKIKELIYSIQNWGRKFDVSSIAGARSPFHMEKSLVRGANEFWVFNIIDKAEIDEFYFKKDFNIIRRLKPGEYIIYKR